MSWEWSNCQYLNYKILYHEIKNILRDTMISDKIGGAVKIDAKNKGNVCTEKHIQGKWGYDAYKQNFWRGKKVGHCYATQTSNGCLL